ncbi:MAG TPA: hypothetical protein VGK39_03895 [Cyclobacteriaceae bacterium]
MATELTKQQQEAQALAPLWKDSNSDLLIKLKTGQYNQISKSVSNRVSDLLDCEPIESLIKHAGSGVVQMYVEAELIKLAANINVNQALNLKNDQVPVIASHLMENYKWESIEDFTLCFRRAAMGLYGEIYRVDGAVIGQWFSRYLDEKYDALEQRKAKEKHEEKIKPIASDPTHADKCIKQILENLGAKPEVNDNSKENAYQRYKLEMPKETPEQVREKLRMFELKQQYGGECRDLQTGRLKPGMPSFEDWLKDKL